MFSKSKPHSSRPGPRRASDKELHEKSSNDFPASNAGTDPE